jgi:hypothetical protein
MKLLSQLLHPRDEVLFATTFTFDLLAFNDYMFPQLGSPPINAVVLADADRLEELYRTLAEGDRLADVRRAGQQYLLRPVNWNNKSFHAKTYLTGNRKGGRLAITSGNLGLSGLSEGNEVACLFASDDDDGRATIASWVAWMDRVVASCGHDLLDDRWHRLLTDLPWLQQAGFGHSYFHHTLDVPLIDQLVDACPKNVDELLIGAPFFDETADAVRQLLEKLRPRRVEVRLGRGSSVDGKELRKTLEQDGSDFSLFRPIPDAYVHAKLIAVVTGDDAVIMSGSANFSKVALLRAGKSANCEVAVIARTSADFARAAVRGRLGWQEFPASELAGFMYRKDETTSPALAVHLTQARVVEDPPTVTAAGKGRLPGDSYLRLSRSIGPVDLTLPVSLQGLSDWEVTITIPTEVDVGLPAIAVVMSGQEPVSNYLVVDDPTALAAMLGARRPVDSPTDGLPAEGADSTMGQFVSWLRASTDFSGLAGLEGSGLVHQPGYKGADPEDSEEPIPDDLELTIHKRRGQRWRANAGGRLDDLLAALSLLGARIPQSRGLHVINPDDGQHPPPPVPLTPTTPKISLRLGNALEKMCRGAVDRRLFDRDPDTALKNIVSLVEGLWVLDGVVPCNTWLSLDRRRALLKLLLQGMAGTETVAGLISTVDAEDRQAAVKAMAEAPELVADLLMSAIDPEGRIQSAVVFDWQPLLNRALALGMARGRTDADRERLTRLAEFMDDEHWQERTSKAANLWFELIREGAAWIVLTGEPEELFDSRAVAQIIGAWFRYDGLVRGSRLGLRFGHSPSRVGSDRWRVALVYGAGCFASWPDIGASGVSTERLSQGIVDKFAEAELTLRYLFPDAPIRERASA